MQQLALPVPLPLCLPYLPAPLGVLDRLEAADRDGNVNDLLDELEGEGWEYIGSDSCFCAVMLSPDGDRVLKLGTGIGAEATIKAALALPDNPHLPRVYGFKPLLNHDYAFAAEMEALEPLPDVEGNYTNDDYDDTAPKGDYRPQCPSFYRWNANVAWRGGRFAFQSGPDLTKMADGPLKDAFAALVDASDDYGGCSWDVHDENIMVRPSDGTIVLNDLLA